MSKKSKANEVNKINKVGERVFNTRCSEWMEIVEYNDSNNIIVLFDDGHIKKTGYKIFSEGKIRKYSLKEIAIMRVGEQKVNKYGEGMIIAEYNSADNIIVRFEDGIELKCQYKQFEKGNVKNSVGRVGKSKINSQGLLMTIIKYNNSLDIDVQFEDGVIINGVYDQFYKGKFRNPNVKTVFNRGYIGVGKYKSVDSFGEHPKSYKYWSSMFYRCYSEAALKTHPSYRECNVDKKFYNYQDFMEWYNKNYYEVDNEVMCLDKDILVKGNKLYHPDKCVFIPERLNTLIMSCKGKRVKYPIGVHLHTVNNNYIAKRSGQGSKHLGSYLTPELAFYAYKKDKEVYVKKVTKRYKGLIPDCAYNALMNWVIEITD